ncbi:hypothetical protein LIA77_08998 [Sarocladium implicatum]|nr:hypothetical protein LIA77_08998 [Sarocladium implicatum]
MRPTRLTSYSNLEQLNTRRDFDSQAKAICISLDQKAAVHLSASRCYVGFLYHTGFCRAEIECSVWLTIGWYQSTATHSQDPRWQAKISFSGCLFRPHDHRNDRATEDVSVMTSLEASLTQLGHGAESNDVAGLEGAGGGASLTRGLLESGALYSTKAAYRCVILASNQ